MKIRTFFIEPQKVAYNTGTFKVYPNGKVTRWVIDYLKKIGVIKAVIEDRTIEYKAIEIDLNDLADAVFRNLKEWNRQFGGFDPGHRKYLIVGRDVYLRILKEDTGYMLQFKVPDDFHSTYGKNFDVLFCGIHVIMLPNIEGMLLLPELSDLVK